MTNNTLKLKIQKMKKLSLIIVLGLVLLTSCEKKDDCGCDQEEINILMGAGQAMDVYYSFNNDVVSSTDRTDWDLAFSVPLQTASILINEGAGVELYNAGSTSEWDEIDTSGIAGWEKLYNDKTDWMSGAFNLDSDGMFDFGWAVYDQATHDVTGKYVYVIKLSDGSYKKLNVIEKTGSTNTYVLRWAGIDGSNQVDASFSPSAYTDKKHFIHYSISNQGMVEIEPDMDSWDLLFTRYVGKIPMGPGVEMDYPVMGVLMNQNLTAANVTGIAVEDAQSSDAMDGFSNQADIIGWNWKSQDPVTHDVSIVEDNSYFVESASGVMYKIYFTDYAGVSSGNLTFQQKKME